MLSYITHNKIYCASRNVFYFHPLSVIFLNYVPFKWWYTVYCTHHGLMFSINLFLLQPLLCSISNSFPLLSWKILYILQQEVMNWLSPKPDVFLIHCHWKSISWTILDKRQNELCCQFVLEFACVHSPVILTYTCSIQWSWIYQDKFLK